MGITKKWDFSLIDELDYILNWFALWENRGMERNFETIYNALYTSRYKERNGYTKDTAGIIEVCLGKLIRDGFITENKAGKLIDMNTGMETLETRYGITFEGLLFLETNISYQIEFKSSDLRKFEAKTLQNQMETNAWRLNYMTAVLCVATGALAVSEIIKIYKTYPDVFCRYIVLVSMLILVITLGFLYNKKQKSST